MLLYVSCPSCSLRLVAAFQLRASAAVPGFRATELDDDSMSRAPVTENGATGQVLHEDLARGCRNGPCVMRHGVGEARRPAQQITPLRRSTVLLRSAVTQRGRNPPPTHGVRWEAPGLIRASPRHDWSYPSRLFLAIFLIWKPLPRSSVSRSNTATRPVPVCAIAIFRFFEVRSTAA